MINWVTLLGTISCLDFDFSIHRQAINKSFPIEINFLPFIPFFLLLHAEHGRCCFYCYAFFVYTSLVAMETATALAYVKGKIYRIRSERKIDILNWKELWYCFFSRFFFHDVSSDVHKSVVGFVRAWYEEYCRWFGAGVVKGLRVEDSFHRQIKFDWLIIYDWM